MATCYLHAGHEVSQQRSPLLAAASLEGQQDAQKVKGVPVHHRREKLPSFCPEAQTCFHSVKQSGKPEVLQWQVSPSICKMKGMCEYKKSSLFLNVSR